MKNFHYLRHDKWFVISLAFTAVGVVYDRISDYMVGQKTGPPWFF